MEDDIFEENIKAALDGDAANGTVDNMRFHKKYGKYLRNSKDMRPPQIMVEQPSNSGPKNKKEEYFS